MLGGCGLLQKGLELFLGQRDAVGQQLLKKPHALAEPVRPVLALLLFLLLDKPLVLQTQKGCYIYNPAPTLVGAVFCLSPKDFPIVSALWRHIFQKVRPRDIWEVKLASHPIEFVQLNQHQIDIRSHN